VEQNSGQRLSERKKYQILLMLSEAQNPARERERGREGERERDRGREEGERVSERGREGEREKFK